MRVTLVSLALATLLTACGGPGPEPGRAAVCLGNDADDTFAGGEVETSTITGTVAKADGGPDGIYDCTEEVALYLTVTDDDGVTWTLGYGIADPNGTDVTTELDFTEGEQVTLMFRAVRSFGDAAGFVLEDDDGLVAAIDIGTWGYAVEATDLTGLTVTNGEAFATERDECGRAADYVTRFEGDVLVEAEHFSSTDLAIDGEAYSAWAIENMDWQGQVSCTDLAGRRIWAVLRDVDE